MTCFAPDTTPDAAVALEDAVLLVEMAGLQLHNSRTRSDAEALKMRRRGSNTPYRLLEVKDLRPSQKAWAILNVLGWWNARR